MPSIPHVQPGEVIRASVINLLIDFYNAGGTGTAPATGVEVPDLFGRTLDQARALLTQPTTNLALGTSLDTFGAVVDPNAPGAGSRFVLNQAPAATTRVPVGTSVHLVIAAASSGPALPPPVVTRTETLIGAITSTFRVGETLVVVGSGFNIAAALNIVTFDGQPATSVTSDPANPTQRLRVVVPTGIPAGPVNPGDPAKPNVQLAVRNSGSLPATFAITVDAPSGVAMPDITSFAPSQQFVGQNVTITGVNFSNILARNVVTLNGTAATLVSTTPTQIVFIVPNLPGLGPTSGSSLLVNITVTVNDGGGNPIGSDVSSTLFTARRP